MSPSTSIFDEMVEKLRVLFLERSRIDSQGTDRSSENIS